MLPQPILGEHGRFGRMLLALFASVLMATSALAAECTHPYYWGPTAGYTPKPNNCFGGTGFRCYQGMAGAWYFALKNPACDPYSPQGCAVQLRVPLEFPGVEDMVAEDGLFGSPLPVVYWYDDGTADPCPGTQTNCGQVSICGTAGFGGKLNSDFLETWVERGGVTCSNVGQQTGEYAIRPR